jgi:hypothetical protein
MRTMSAAADPNLANRIIEEVVDKPAAQSALDSIPMPVDTVYRLCGGYTPDGRTWDTEFEVRELTGRDEEYISRISNQMRIFSAILERGLVRVGQHRSSPVLIDGLLAGDWETVLLAIRIVTFGRQIEAKVTCDECKQPYTVDIDLVDQVKRQEVTMEEVTFVITGRHGTQYKVNIPFGATQRKIMEKESITNGEANTLLLTDCVQTIDGMPTIGSESVLNIPMADRITLVQAIDAKKVGPDLKGVRTKCPYCDAERNTPISIAALFQV